MNLWIRLRCCLLVIIQHKLSFIIFSYGKLRLGIYIWHFIRCNQSFKMSYLPHSGSDQLFIWPSPAHLQLFQRLCWPQNQFATQPLWCLPKLQSDHIRRQRIEHSLAWTWRVTCHYYTGEFRFLYFTSFYE